jgi:hypothetical protein
MDFPLHCKADLHKHVFVTVDVQNDEIHATQKCSDEDTELPVESTHITDNEKRHDS